MTGLSVPTMGRHERGRIAATASLRRHAGALDIRVEIRLVGRGVDLPRLADDEHASIVSVMAGALGSGGWTNRPEVSFNEWGERGRIDLMGTSADRLAVVEVKTEIGDMQDLHGALDIKARLAPTVARRIGWPAGPVTVILAVAATARNRAIVAGHASLFAHYKAIGVSSLSRELRRADAERLLVWVPARTAGRSLWLSGRRRLRPGRALGHGGRGRAGRLQAKTGTE